MQLLSARVPLNYASLFSGIGGFDIGFDRAGMRCVAQAEWDQHASEVLKHHWPNVTHLKDVRDVTRDSFRSIDVLCGGFPCQDVSVAGKRAGLDGERSGLWFEFYRIIKEHTPRWVVIENVPGLLTSNRGRDFAVIIDGLVKCGYCVCWRVLDAQYFGLAQRRKRVFIVASFGDGRCTEVLFEREGSTGNIEPRRTQGEGATTFAIKGAAIGRKPENGPQRGEISADGTSYTLNTSEVHAVAGTLPASGAGTARTGNERNEASLLVPVVASTIQRGEGQGKERGDGCDNLIVAAIDARNSRSNGDISGTLQSKKTGGYSLNYVNPIVIGLSGELTATEEIVSTLNITSSSGGGHPAMAFIGKAGHSTRSIGLSVEHTPTLDTDCAVDVHQPHYGVRRLTPTECERLQGFPDGHTAVNGQSDSRRYKQLGNAVAVPVAEWIARRIVAADTSA